MLNNTQQSRYTVQKKSEMTIECRILTKAQKYETNIVKFTNIDKFRPETQTVTVAPSNETNLPDECKLRQ